MDDYCYAKMATSCQREHSRKSPTEIKIKTEDERMEISNNLILETGKSVDQKLADYVEECKQRTAMIVSLKKAVEFTSKEMKECKSQTKKVEENMVLKEEMLGKSKRCAVCEEETGPHVYINLQRTGDVQQMIGHSEEVPPQLLGDGSTLRQEHPWSPHIKEEEKELLITQEPNLNQLPLTVVSVKTEDDEEKPQVDHLLAPLSDSEVEDDIEKPLSSDTDCEGDMRTQTDNKHTGCSKKKNGDKTCLIVSACGSTHEMRSHIEEKSSNCSVCGKTLSCKTSLTRHLRTHTEKPFNCSVCSKRFYLKAKLTVHMRTHTGEKPFSCSVCDRKFTSKIYMKGHMRTHTEENPVICPVCGKGLSLNTNMTEHMRTHTEEKTFSCSFCGKKFHQGTNLQKHMRTHTGEKPFSCLVCSKRFSCQGNLSRHARTHTGEKPFKCSVCSKRFADNVNLKEHMRSHTGEKPLSCSICGETFSRRLALSGHMITHTGEKPFHCSVCGKTYTTKFNLVKHIRVHTGEKPFSCSVCGLSFSDRTLLKRHIVKHSVDQSVVQDARESHLH
ncbi:gastrula zinc finger protein XlCGF57.1-like isoform X3 [Nerophis ophidion]|uniref:gastrula zinc finger protein XlCGF57.1-like isoform X3 n=1 Tax=Nerophis ophidion TaxID=159077 RepID=UPI002ADF5157|nr:gastrula zinc finger protein XlCGF57.1-like isoform X3 [Nerophis ophidion]